MTDQILRQSEDGAKATNAVVEAAYRLAGTEEIGMVTVVTSRRPTYAELARYRQEADARDLGLVVDASGVTFRPRSSSPVLRAPPSILRWLSGHGRTWFAEFAALSEGTR